MARATAAQNRFAKRADLWLSASDAQAQRIADGWTEPPANSSKLSTDQVQQLWNDSPSEQPEQDFWTQHDQALASALAQLGPGADPQQVQAAHNQAETAALDSVYPFRAQLVGIGTTELEQQVKRADQIKQLVDGQQEPH